MTKNNCIAPDIIPLGLVKYNLIGKKFGKLKVIGRTHNLVMPSASRITWSCICDCGGYQKAGTSELRSGKKISCGCYRRPMKKDLHLKNKVKRDLLRPLRPGPYKVPSWITSDYTGSRSGRLLVLGFSHQKKTPGGKYRSYWHCLCDCGNRSFTDGGAIVTGHTKSCGYQCSLQEQSNIIHGMCESVEYMKWSGMKTRCNDINNADYGGRGITYCPEWESFQRFYADMGDCPKGLTLERIDVDGNYCPENCIWASDEIQANNRRNTVRFKGDSLTLYCKSRGLNPKALRKRILKGWCEQCTEYGDPNGQCCSKRVYTI